MMPICSIIMIFGIFVTQQCALDAYEAKARRKDRKWSYISKNFLCLLYKVEKNEKYAFQAGEINQKKEYWSGKRVSKKIEFLQHTKLTVCTVYHDAVS